MTISVIAMVGMLSGCNQGGSYEQALQKEIDRRVESGELAYPSEEIASYVPEEETEEQEEKIVGYDIDGNPVEVDGVDVIQYEDTIYYRLGGYYQSGEYVAVVDEGEDSGYYSVTMEANPDIIVRIGCVNQGELEIFDTLDGKYISFTHCKAYTLDQAPEVKKTEDGAYPEGIYKIGVQIPAGEYVVRGNAPAVQILADLNEDSDSGVAYFRSNKSAIATVKDGEYIKAVHGDIYPIELTEDLKSSNGIYKEGMYKVGFHMPAGTYKLKADVDTAYAEIYNTNNAETKIEKRIKAEPEDSFTVQDGQYVVIIGGKATLQ